MVFCWRIGTAEVDVCKYDLMSWDDRDGRLMKL